jgi:hypothetical protein
MLEKRENELPYSDYVELEYLEKLSIVALIATCG